MAIAVTAHTSERMLASDALLMRKLTLRLIPFLFLLYFVACIDRVNVGFAALSMNRDLGFGPAVYGFGAGVFFIGYALFEVPSNLVLYRVGARAWLARIMVTWGLISAAMLLVRGPVSFYVLRFLLGAAEGGFFPGVLYYLTRWFPAEERSRAIARFMTAVPWASAIGAPLAGGLLALRGRLGMAGWQWLFLLEGVPAVVLGIMIPFVLPERPETARWLTPLERLRVLALLRAEQERVESGDDVPLRQVLANGFLWRLGSATFLGLIGSYGMVLWLPQILQRLSGLGDSGVALLSAVPYLAAALVMVLVGAHSDRTGERVVHAAVSSTVAGVAFFASALLHAPALALAAFTLAAIGNQSKNGPLWALPSIFLKGRAAALGFAMMSMIGNLGGMIGSNLVGITRDLTGGFAVGLVLLALSQLALVLVLLPLRRAPAVAARARPRGAARHGPG